MRAVNLAALLLGMMSACTCAKSPMPQQPVAPLCGQAAGNHATPHWVRDPYPRSRAVTDELMSQPVNFGIYIGLRDEAGLHELIGQLHDPSHPNYQRYLKPYEFLARFGPTQAMLQEVTGILEASGMQVEPLPHGTVVHARGSRDALQNSFNVSVVEHIGQQGRVSFLFDAPVTSLGSVPVSVVQGIYEPPARAPHVRTGDVRALNTLGFYGYSADAIRKAYNVPPALTGRGQKIGIVSLEGYDPADIAAYADAQGIRRVPLKDILVAGHTGGVTNPQAQIEVSLDIEMVNAMAPNAAEIRVYIGANRDFLRVLNEVANPSISDMELMRFVSCSWGAPESQMAPAASRAEEAIFLQMAAQGQSFFAASGDNGAQDDGHGIGTDDPASHPNVIAVGGTTLHVDGNGRWQSEQVWAGSGGGESCFWPAPAWQKAMANPQGPHQWLPRTVPDIALNANPSTGYAVYNRGMWTTVGGTSAAAPLWAGMAALLNESLRPAKRTLGPLGPTLYRIALNADTASAFHDIQDGGSNGYYKAVPGYDDATGWGSVDFSMLNNAVLRLP